MFIGIRHILNKNHYEKSPAGLSIRLITLHRESQVRQIPERVDSLGDHNQHYRQHDHCNNSKSKQNCHGCHGWWKRQEIRSCRIYEPESNRQRQHGPDNWTTPAEPLHVLQESDVRVPRTHFGGTSNNLSILIEVWEVTAQYWYIQWFGRGSLGKQ